MEHTARTNNTIAFIGKWKAITCIIIIEISIVLSYWDLRNTQIATTDKIVEIIIKYSENNEDLLKKESGLLNSKMELSFKELKEEGLRQGINQTKTKIAINCFKSGMKENEIANLLEVGVKEVTDLLKQPN